MSRHWGTGCGRGAGQACQSTLKGSWDKAHEGGG